MIPIYNNIDKYKKYAFNAIDSGWISNYGEYIEKSENKLKELLNINYAILMANGTCATHCIFLALKYKYPEINTIYLPNNVYVAVYNCCLMVYEKLNVKILKTDQNTLNFCVDIEYLQSLEKKSAIVIVHNIGNIINVLELKKYDRI
jgi:dTDP-4-amino-4,6-dideoxygalactose transaminase